MLFKFVVKDFIDDREFKNLSPKKIEGYKLGLRKFQDFLTDEEIVDVVIFGCMDSYDGRNALNKLCVYYSIPYFDLGVFLDADGKGSVSQVCGTVRYMQPDGSSLFSRKVYTGEQLRAADMRRSNPKEYQNQIREKYIKGIQEERPAVISVNTLIASLAVNEFLARIHQFRDDPNDEISTIRLSLTQNRFITEPEGDPCGVLAKKVGLGDVRPLLDMPILSIGGAD